MRRQHFALAARQRDKALRPLSSGRSDSALKRAENPQKQGFAAHAPQSRRMGRKRPRRLHRRIKRSVDSPGTLALATFASFRRPLRRRAFAYRAEHSGERADRPAELRRQLVPRLLAQSRRLAPGLRPGPGGPAAGRRGRAAPGRGRRSAGRRRAGLRMGRALCRRRLGLRLAALVRRPPLGDLLERTMCRPTRQRFRGRLLRLGEMSEDDAQPLHRDSAPSSRADEGRRKTGVLRDALRRLAMTTWPPRLTAARTASSGDKKRKIASNAPFEGEYARIRSNVVVRCQGSILGLICTLKNGPIPLAASKPSCTIRPA